MKERLSGILMPVFSLPGTQITGTLGKPAYRFADFLHAAGQTCWQILPLGPTGYGNSPYQSYSSFAGNPNFIDYELLLEDGLISREVIDNDTLTLNDIENGKTAAEYPVLIEAKRNGWMRDKAAIDTFLREEKWLDTYAKFMALKKANGMKEWMDWERKEYGDDLREEYELQIYVQFLFYKQWDALKKYVNDLGIRIIGDLPIYVALDSADVWSEPEQFMLDSDNRPIWESGVPPDYFSEDGQHWGNPIYDYKHMKEDGYSWWIRRIGGMTRLYDAIRIDHFRGLASYWAIPQGETTAKNGHWEPGPGMDLVGRLTTWFKDTIFIAEDLGTNTPDVEKLLDDSGIPGMKVLQFAFADEAHPSDYLPHNFITNCVCYTGTHDNTTLKDWYENADEKEADYIRRYFDLHEGESVAEGIIRGGMRSVAKLFVVPMADWLELGAEGRINTPGTVGHNWNWKVAEDVFTQELAERILNITTLYER